MMTFRSLFYLSMSVLVLLMACFSCKKWNPEVSSSESILRISTEGDPTTLDPRQVRDLPTATILYMLYEGLMRIDFNGEPQPALAEKVTISPDQKTYTFKLRQSAWSNGQPVTAQDFEQSWKSLLDPNFPAPNAYQFYVIKGAKAAKERHISVDQVGIHALDDKTLVVELEHPAPYFLNLTAIDFFYPVSAELRQKESIGDLTSESNFVSNGPFKLDKWSRHNELIAVKNPHYWDNASVQLDKIIVVVVDNSTALQMFGRNELDWIGSPMSTIPTDAIATLKTKTDLYIKPGLGTQLFRVNIEKPPFNHAKVRQAFNLALNRQELIDHILQGNQTPALGLIPPTLLKRIPLYEDHNVNQARTLLQEALEEQNIKRKDFAPITLCYASGERSHKIAQVAQQQWKQALGVEVQLQNCESKAYFEKLKMHDYQMSIGSWFADFMDPIAFLDVFKFKDNGTNNTQWENAHYIRLLDQSSQTPDPSQRKHLLEQAETILLTELPIIPVFYSSYNYLKDASVKGVYFSELGYLDFKNAFIEIIVESK